MQPSNGVKPAEDSCKSETNQSSEDSVVPLAGLSLTVIDGAAVAAEVGFHQRSLFLALLGSPSTGPSVHVGLDHQGLLPLLLLLLLKEHPLAWRGARKKDRKGRKGCTDSDVRVATCRSSRFSSACHRGGED